MPELRIREILRILDKHKVEYVVVGGVAAMLHGAGLPTVDVDVVHRRSADNIERMLAALEELDAVYRIQPARRLRPNASHLESKGHQLLLTKHGMLDVLGAVGFDSSYEDLRPVAEMMEIGEGLTVAVIDLKTLIRLKQEAGREKDLAALPVLRATLARREASKSK